MSSPILWGPGGIANNLQNRIGLATGEVLENNGPKNYITYNNFENGLTTGWATGTTGTLTNGIPTGSPTFSSSPAGSTLLATNTNVISGTYSLQMNSGTTPAAAAGDMFHSDSLAIDMADRAKVLTFSVYYNCVGQAQFANFSGTNANTLAYAVYDVTNSVWLSTTGNFSFTQSSPASVSAAGLGIATGTFQTNVNTANLRLCVYYANAPTNGVVVNYDRFFLGPQIRTVGTAMSDWQDYVRANNSTGAAPTPGAGAVMTQRWRRVGDSMEIMYTYFQNAAGSAGTGNYLFYLPSGYQMDASKLNISPGGIGIGAVTGNAVGTGYTSITATINTAAAASLYVVPYDTQGFQLVYDSNPVNVATIGSAAFSFGQTNLYISFTAKVPIAGWSSNTVQSSDTDTRVVAASYKGISSTSVVGGTAPTFVNQMFDTAAAYSGNAYIAPVTGYYEVTLSGQYAASQFSDITVRVANVVQAYLGSITTARATVSGLVKATAGQAIAVVFESSGTVSDATNINLFINRLSGPAVVQTSETVAALYKGNPSGTVANNYNNVVAMTTKIQDSHNAYNSSTGVYTVPISGSYSIVCTATVDGTYIVSNYLGASLNVDGTSVIDYSHTIGGSVSSDSHTISVQSYPLLAGQQVTIRFGSSATSPTFQASPNRSLFSIVRIK